MNKDLDLKGHKEKLLITIIYVKTTVTSALCLFKALLLISSYKEAEEI